jgi:hypothetical protein
MAQKFDELDEDIQKVFDLAISCTDLERVIKIEIVGNDRQKEVGKVVKTNDLTKYLSDDVDVVVIVNQMIFNQLTPDLQEMVAIELITEIGYDSESDKLVLAKKDISTFSSILKKYGYEAYERKQLSVKSLYDKKQNDENVGDSPAEE